MNQTQQLNQQGKTNQQADQSKLMQPIPITQQIQQPLMQFPSSLLQQGPQNQLSAPFNQLINQNQETIQYNQVQNDVGFEAHMKKLNEKFNETKEEIQKLPKDPEVFKNHQLPLARVKKIMKSDEDVRMISAEAPVLFAKACEIFIIELTHRSWLFTEEGKRRTLQKNDIASCIYNTEIFDFLIDIIPKEELKTVQSQAKRPFTQNLFDQPQANGTICPENYVDINQQYQQDNFLRNMTSFAPMNINSIMPQNLFMQQQKQPQMQGMQNSQQKMLQIQQQQQQQIQQQQQQQMQQQNQLLKPMMQGYNFQIDNSMPYNNNILNSGNNTKEGKLVYEQ